MHTTSKSNKKLQFLFYLILLSCMLSNVISAENQTFILLLQH